MATQADYDAELQERMLATQSVSSYADRALKFFCESQMNPNSEAEFLDMAKTMALMDIANTLREIARRM
jgi:hypothetical protein